MYYECKKCFVIQPIVSTRPETNFILTHSLLHELHEKMLTPPPPHTPYINSYMLSNVTCNSCHGKINAYTLGLKQYINILQYSVLQYGAMILVNNILLHNIYCNNGLVVLEVFRYTAESFNAGYLRSIFYILLFHVY